jgi:methyl-accepting chemotaxis protein
MLSAQVSQLPRLFGGRASPLKSPDGAWAGRKARAHSILARLIFAFALITSLTVLASGVAVVSYGSLGEKLHLVEKQSLPRYSELFVLSRQASALSSLSAYIAAAENMNDLQKAVGAVTDLWASMQGNLSRLAALADNAAGGAGLHASAEDLANSAVVLAISVARRLDLSGERQALIARAAAMRRELSEKIAPLVDDAIFNLDLGLRLSAEDRHKTESALRALGRNDLPVLVGVMELKTEANLIGGLLSEIALAPERSQLAPLRDRLFASVDRARKALASLDGHPGVKDIGPALEKLLEFSAIDSIMTVRDQELAASEAEWASVAASRAKGERLAAEAEKAAGVSREAVSLAVAGTNAEAETSRAILLSLSGLSLAALIGAFLFVRRSITGRLNTLSTAVRKLAAGDLTVAAPSGGNDEIADMGAAVETFRANALKVRELEDEQSRTIAHAAARQARLETVIVEFRGTVTSVVASLKNQVELLRGAAGTLSEAAETATFEAATAAHVSASAADNSNAVAAATEELSCSIREISDQAHRTNSVVEAATHEASRTNKDVAGLAAAAEEIGSIVAVIRGIADQTNLLALNATIEAARAGEAGRGFAVVAAEVKELSAQTAKATDAIAEQIQAIQGSTSQAVGAIQSVAGKVSEIQSFAGAIAAAAEEQTAAAQEIANNVALAAEGSQKAAKSSGEVSQVAGKTKQQAASVASVSLQLSEVTAQLSTAVASFVSAISETAAAQRHG